MPKDNIPEIRVAGFSEVQWSKKKCEDLLTERNVQHPQSEEYPLVSFTIEDGVTPKTERYERESLVAGDKNAKKYKETRLNDIVYNPANLKFGAIARNKYGNAVFSPIYVTFDVNENFAVPEFVEVLVSKKDFIQDALQYQKGTVYERMSVCSTDFLNLDVKIPSVAEQRQIGSIFERLDALISQHQHKHEALVAVKKAMLEKMFPKEGENVPEIRFVGFTDPWEQRKVGEVGSVSMCRRIFKEQTSESGDIPFYKIGTFGGQADAYISSELFAEYRSKYPYPKEGDILISASGSIGRTVEFTGKNEYFQDSNIVWLSHDDRLNNTFLKCFYSVVKWAGIEGSTIKRLYNDNILNTVISMPSVAEQKRIGTFFKELDNLITLHQRKCEVLKNLKSALLSKMFV